MAVVMLALNGEGLGHLIRAMIVCSALKSVGERPVVFSQGNYQLDDALQFPAKQIPSLWRAPDDVRRRVAAELYTMAAISLPAVVVEDTHPNPIRLPPDVRRVLMVRPTSFEYLCMLKQNHDGVYAAFLLCDSPDSPTWPYTPDETRQVMGWDKWHVVGPIYRTATETEIRDVRRRYDLADDQELCVFTMGGGGVHDPNDRDVERFFGLASEVADRIKRPGSSVRLIFVQGPYFRSDIAIPERFEVVRHEPQMPALLRIAKGAVIRAGFNTTWECLAAGTPFIPLIGTTVAEPVPERVTNLQALGLLPGEIDRFWFDGAWREEFRRKARAIVDRHPGRPQPRLLQSLIVGCRDDSGVASGTAGARTVELPTHGSVVRFVRGRRPLPLTIRIDDVTGPEDAIVWLLELLASRGLRASLEVVPYLAGFDDGFLDRFDTANEFFEVSQHGYAHVPRTKNGGRRHEFAPDSASATEHELSVIGLGKRLVAEAFPRRFTGGFSPPFDALPPWLPAAWHQQGGKFLSCLYTNHFEGAPLPVVRAGVDVWDWSLDRAIPRHRIRRKLEHQAGTDRHIGLVLHPRCLRSRWEQARFVSILNFVQRSGVVTTSLRELAATRTLAWQPSPPGLGSRLKSLFIPAKQPQR